MERCNSIWTYAVRLWPQVIFSIIIMNCIAPTASLGQKECLSDTIPPFCYVSSYTIQGDEDGGILFFPEIAADLCSDIETSTFYHLEFGRILNEGEMLPCGEHIIQNIVSDYNANYTTCTFKVIVHCGEYTPPEFKPIAHRIQPNEIIHYPLGSLSAQWESGHLGPEAISCGTGDPGGPSYGLFQLSSKKGTLQDYLHNEGKEYLPILRDHRPGTKDFNQQWKMIADLDEKAFVKSQYEYIYRTHYKRFCYKIENDFQVDVEEFSSVVRDVFWSLSVQHGPSNNLLKNTFSQDELFVLSEEEIIEKIYEERLRLQKGILVYFPNVSQNIKKSLIRRYHHEKQMALQRLFNMELAASRE